MLQVQFVGTDGGATSPAKGTDEGVVVTHPPTASHAPTCLQGTDAGVVATPPPAAALLVP